jgi:hypothetical protein
VPSSATFAENGKGNLQDNKNSFSGEIPAKKWNQSFRQLQPEKQRRILLT